MTRMVRQAPGDTQWAAQFRALLASRRKAHHLRIEHADPKSGRDFDLSSSRRRQWRRAHHYAPDFDAFPMFSSDGKRLVWASNRNGKAA